MYNVVQEEGIIVKAANSPWRCNDRGNAWLKIKPDYLAVSSAGAPTAFRFVHECCLAVMPSQAQVQPSALAKLKSGASMSIGLLCGKISLCCPAGKATFLPLSVISCRMISQEVETMLL